MTLSDSQQDTRLYWNSTMRGVISLALQQSRLLSGTSEPHGLLTERAAWGCWLSTEITLKLPNLPTAAGWKNVQLWTCKPRQNISTVNSMNWVFLQNLQHLLRQSTDSHVFMQPDGSCPINTETQPRPNEYCPHIHFSFIQLIFLYYFPPISLHYFPHSVLRQSVETFVCIYLSFRWYLNRWTHPPDWMKLIIFGD